MKRKIRDGDLVRIAMKRNRNILPEHFLYGTVLSTIHPMKDDPDWTDHKILWYHDGSETIEYCEELELVSDE